MAYYGDTRKIEGGTGLNIPKLWEESVRSLYAPKKMAEELLSKQLANKISKPYAENADEWFRTELGSKQLTNQKTGYELMKERTQAALADEFLRNKGISTPSSNPATPTKGGWHTVGNGSGWDSGPVIPNYNSAYDQEATTADQSTNQGGYKITPDLEAVISKFPPERQSALRATLSGNADAPSATNVSMEGAAPSSQEVVSPSSAPMTPPGRPPSSAPSTQGLTQKDLMGYMAAKNRYGYNDPEIERQLTAQKATATEHAKGMEKVSSEIYKENLGALQGLQNQGVALDTITGLIENNPEFKNVTGPIGTRVTNWLGTPEQKELLGGLQTASGEIALQVAPALKGAFTGRDQTLINSIKANPGDFPDVFVGKLKAQKLINDVLLHRADLTAQYIEQGQTPRVALRMAAEQTPLSKYEPLVNKLKAGNKAEAQLKKQVAEDTSQKSGIEKAGDFVTPFNRAVGSTLGAATTGAIQGLGKGITNMANLFGADLPEVNLMKYMPTNSASRVSGKIGELAGEYGPYAGLAKALKVVPGLRGAGIGSDIARGAVAGGATGGNDMAGRLGAALTGGLIKGAEGILPGNIANKVVNRRGEVKETASKLYDKVFQGMEKEHVRVPTIDSETIIKNSDPLHHKSLQRFMNEPTIENANKAQSDLGKIYRKYKKANDIRPLPSEGTAVMQKARDAQKRINGVLAQKLEAARPGAATELAEANAHYAKNVVPYSANKDINAFRNGDLKAKDLVKKLLANKSFMEKVGKEHPELRLKNLVKKGLESKYTEKALMGIALAGGSAALGLPLYHYFKQ